MKLTHFRRFTDLEIKDIPETTKLVVLAGPNGCGKSSLFDAFSVWYQMSTGFGWTNDPKYYFKPTDVASGLPDRITIEVYGGKDPRQRGSFYFRSAYRNDPEFLLGSLSRAPRIADEMRLRRMIESDAAVTQNYQRLASQALEDIFDKEPGETTIAEFRERVIGSAREPLKRLFPELVLNSLGNPLDQGTFRFDKGSAKGFDYKNLSGGEKAAFDLLLDIVVKKDAHLDAIYCIDEPEAHMSTRLQGALLQELYDLVPDASPALDCQSLDRNDAQSARTG